MVRNMCLFNKRKLQEKSLENKINEIIKPYGYNIVIFKVYYKKEYSIFLKLVANEKINLKFTTNNNSIYLNNELICDNSYHLEGFNDLPFKFIECVELEMKKERTIDFSLKNIKVIFYSNKRKSFPILNSSIENRAGYRPHLVIKGTTEYLGIEFYRSQLQSFDKYGTASIRLLYDGVDYSGLKIGTKFDILEGAKVVGEGEIIEF